jgi:predicted O-methyltransferase YrrM
MPFKEPRHHNYTTFAYHEGNLTDRLFDVALSAIVEARNCDLKWLSDRMRDEQHLAQIWPGQHYRLLAGLAKALKPKKVVEIGTWTGTSALAIKAFTLGELITVDVVPWRQIKQTTLLESDFTDGTFRQVVGDLKEEKFFASFTPTLEACDLIFLDGPKDVIFEETFLRRLANLKLAKNPIVVLDDIKLWNMLKIWNEISRPKLDFTSFGHYTGTGLIDWNG